MRELSAFFENEPEPESLGDRLEAISKQHNQLDLYDSSAEVCIAVSGFFP
jgi:hypothetical protein